MRQHKHMAKAGLSLVALITLIACTADQQNDLTRSAAKRTVTPIVQDKFPGVPVEPSVNCVIDNASSRELISLASEAVTGPTASSVEIVANIVSRPDTLECLVTSGLPALLP